MPKNVLTDAEVKLTGYLSEKKYPESFRLIRYYDEEDDREFTFLTNAKQLSALDVANLYQKRWLVELFFYDKYIIMQSSHSRPDAKMLIA
jgi:IS4 transposase